MIDSSHIVTLDREVDIHVACETTARLASKAGLDRYRSAAIETAVSEICHNALRHADGGWISLRLIHPDLQVVVTDRGPSADPSQRSGGLGIGLAGAGRLMRDLTVTSAGGGSVVTMTHPISADGTTHRSFQRWSVRTVYRAKAGQDVTGDAGGAAEADDGSLRLVLADGLGSGPAAAESSERLVSAISQEDWLSPATALAEAHHVVRETRGAAAAAVLLSEDGHGRHAGLGDVSCFITEPRFHPPSRPGIVGRDDPTHDNPFSAAPDAVVMLWTDGLHIDPASLRPPATGAEFDWMESVVLTHGDPRDDATLLLAKRRRR